MELKKKWGGGKIYEGKEKSQEGIALQRAGAKGAGENRGGADRDARQDSWSGEIC